MLTTILAAAVVLGVLIFVHELGHFVTAKLAGIEVPRFSIGFGPRVIGFRRGETEYVISLLPLGGYVKMAGMEEMEDIEGGSTSGERRPPEARKPGPRDFESKSLAARTLVISAGVIMNLLFAVVAFTAIGLVWGTPGIPESVVGNIIEERIPAGAEALTTIPRNARITAVGRSQVDDFEDLRIALGTARPGPVEIHFADASTLVLEVPAAEGGRDSLIAAIEPVTRSAPILDSIAADGAAAAAGLRSGDRILLVTGRPIETWQEFGAAIEASAGQPLAVTVARGSDTLEVALVPELRTLDNGMTASRVGVSGRAIDLSAPRQRLGPVAALAYGGSETWRWVRLTVDFLVKMLTGQLSARNVGGPILITQISGEAARAGLETLLNFMALLSVNLAVLNLLPIPVLDGGHLVFLLVEAVRGRPVSLEQRIRLTKVGFILILALMTFAIGNDIVRWIGF